MRIDRNYKQFIISPDETIIAALEKMNQSGKRFILLVSSSGILEGVFTDGDLRHWITVQKNFNLKTNVIEAANKNFISSKIEDDPQKIESYFSEHITFIPLVDHQKRLSAIAFKNENEISINDFVLRPYSNVFVIAEIGNNHNGDIKLAKKLVDHVIASGADCAKFQMRQMKSLYRNVTNANESEDLGSQYVLDLLSKFQLSDEEMIEVFDYCKSKGILPLCTPWDLDSLKILEDYGMPAYKVASADLTNHELLKALAKTGKPLIISTGMSEEAEIVQSKELLIALGAPFVFLHCNSTYPAPFHDINLRYIDRLKQITSSQLVGYSGHERGYSAVLAAVALGACIIEKHITLDRTMEGNDHKVSLLPGEFTDMVSRIREVEQSLGNITERKLSQGEMINRSTLAKSLVASRAIKIGELITPDMLSTRSPGQGLQPNKIESLVGRHVKRNMAEGDFFFPSDLFDESLVARNYKFTRPWGIPVRYHDAKKMLSKSNMDLLEFHLSYKDLELDYKSFLDDEYLNVDLAVHSPELFSGDHILDLCSFDEDYRKHSINELQKVIDLTNSLKKHFPKTKRPIIVTNIGGYSLDDILSKEDIEKKVKILEKSLNELNMDGVEIIPQTMPPYPWHLGGQRFHNLFIEADQIEEICDRLGLRICFDISHSKLACNQLKQSFKSFIDKVGRFTAHLHIADALGVDGEGLQIGEGDMDFLSIAKDLNNNCPKASFIPEIWQGHKNEGEGFWYALEKLEQYF